MMLGKGGGMSDVACRRIRYSFLLLNLNFVYNEHYSRELPKYLRYFRISRDILSRYPTYLQADISDSTACLPALSPRARRHPTLIFPSRTSLCDWLARRGAGDRKIPRARPERAKGPGSSFGSERGAVCVVREDIESSS